MYPSSMEDGEWGGGGEGGPGRRVVPVREGTYSSKA